MDVMVAPVSVPALNISVQSRVKERSAALTCNGVAVESEFGEGQPVSTLTKP